MNLRLHVQGGAHAGAWGNIRLDALPHVGDEIHVERGGAVHVLRVMRIAHYPVQQSTETTIFGGRTPIATAFCDG